MKRFTKIAAKVGALTAAVLLGAGCAQNSDSGYQYESNNPSNGGVTDNQDQNLESYYFLRHAFMEENAAVDRNASDAEKARWASSHYIDARAYIQQKVKDFEERLAMEPADNFVKTLYEGRLDYLDNNNMLYNYRNPSLVDFFLSPNNLVFPYVLGGISAKLVDVSDTSIKKYEDFKAHYNALALRAYNDSLGSLRDSKDLPYNQERFDINYDLFARTDNTYDIDNHQQIETTLYNMLQTVAAKTGTSIETLVDTMNLSLLHVGLWGARDLAARSGIQLSTNDVTVVAPTKNITYLNTKECLHNVSFGYNYQINKDEREYREQQQQNELSR